MSLCVTNGRWGEQHCFEDKQTDLSLNPTLLHLCWVAFESLRH